MPFQHLQFLPGRLKGPFSLSEQKRIGESCHILAAGVSSHEHGGYLHVLLDVYLAERVDRSAQQTVIELVSESFVHGLEKAEAVGDDVQQQSAARVSLHLVVQVAIPPVLIALHELAQLLQSGVLFQACRQTGPAGSSALDGLDFVTAMAGQGLLQEGLSGSILSLLLLAVQLLDVLIGLGHERAQFVLAVHDL
jgi:hypothetical protein